MSVAQDCENADIIHMPVPDMKQGKIYKNDGV